MKAIGAILCFIVLCSYSCEKPPFVDKFYRIIVINNSPNSIRVLLSDEYATNQYPDTNLAMSKPSLQKIATGNSGYFDSKTPWEENFNKLPADTLSVIFIDNDIYENEPWDSVRAHYNILKRVDLSIIDLKALNYKIIYP